MVIFLFLASVVSLLLLTEVRFPSYFLLCRLVDLTPQCWPHTVLLPVVSTCRNTVLFLPLLASSCHVLLITVCCSLMNILVSSHCSCLGWPVWQYQEEAGGWWRWWWWIWWWRPQTRHFFWQPRHLGIYQQGQVQEAVKCGRGTQRLPRDCKKRGDWSIKRGKFV